MKENLQAVLLEETAAIELSGNCGADGKETPIERLAGLFFFVLCPVSSDQADGPWGRWGLKQLVLRYLVQ